MIKRNPQPEGSYLSLGESGRIYTFRGRQAFYDDRGKKVDAEFDKKAVPNRLYLKTGRLFWRRERTLTVLQVTPPKDGSYSSNKDGSIWKVRGGVLLRNGEEINVQRFYFTAGEDFGTQIIIPGGDSGRSLHEMSGRLTKLEDAVETKKIPLEAEHERRTA